MKIRRFQQRDRFQDQLNSVTDIAFSPSVAALHSFSNSFDHFYTNTDRFVEIKDELVELDPGVLFQLWTTAAAPQDFVREVKSLSTSNRGGASLQGEQTTRQGQFEASSVDNFFSLKVGPKPNASQPAQRRTPLSEKMRFYRATQGRWIVFGDIHYSSHTGFEQSTSVWIFHCSRLIKETIKGKQVEKIQTVELNFPVRESTAQAGCQALRYALEQLGIFDSKTSFYFESEVESVVDTEVFQTYLLMQNGSQHFSNPYRHPWKECSVRNFLRAVRSQIDKSHLPVVAWPAVARSISDFAAKDIDKPYMNETFDVLGS